MSSAHPTLINLPPPPSDPLTPSDVPGTPNSATTSMSELSTVAIKDGHRGHLPHHHHPLDAERADRISRLAGLERVATARQASTAHGGPAGNPTSGYFDANNQPQIMRERSTVGSASATGSVGGRTTWASGSDVNDADKMSEDQEVETSSVGGLSDETPSLVGFGEGARTPARAQSGYGSPAVGKASMAVPPHLRDQTVSPMAGYVGAAGGPSHSMTPGFEPQRQDARMIDGMTYDEGVVDTTNRSTPSNVDASDRLARERFGRDAEATAGNASPMMEDQPDSSSKPGLGKF